MKEVVVRDNIENLIYEIRGKQVMLDSDLARLYECTNGTKDINKAVKRNKERFPEDYYFQLTEDEYNSLRFQSGTLKKGRGKHSKYLPFVFTEQGVAMLSSVLHTDVAVSVSIRIINAFVTLRHYVSNNLIGQKIINKQVLKNTEDIKVLQESFKKFDEKKKDTEIYFNGQIYDAYSKILDIFKIAKKELIIIDKYADKVILDIIKRLHVKVLLITKKNNLLLKQDIEKYNKQYNNLKIKFDNTFHDRYFIIDKEVLYHCGTSVNRIGYKTFSITLCNDLEKLNLILNKIKE